MEHFEGRLDDIAIFDRALKTQTEVALEGVGGDWRLRDLSGFDGDWRLLEGLEDEGLEDWRLLEGIEG